MSLEELVSKYISSAEQVFRGMAITETSVNVDVDKVGEVVDWARAYLEDAKHYREKKKFEVSLTSVAYCEDLLDALRLLGTVNFEWPKKVKKERRAR
jgi:FAD synthetase